MSELEGLEDADVESRNIILRTDLNLPVEDGEPQKTVRFERYMKTVEKLSERGARTLVLAHQGRPSRTDFLSLEDHAELMSEELEHFIDPEEDEPDLEKVENVKLRLYSAEEQEKQDGDIREMKVGQAVEEEIIESEWVAYYLGVSKKWYEKIGIDMEKFRYRQHLSDELSHYASDCWDAETYVTGDWVEITGFAYRGCYDLKKHMERSGEEYRIFKEYDEPKEVEKTEINVEMSELGPKYGEKAGKISEELKKKIRENRELTEQEEITVKVDGDEHNINTDLVSSETVKEDITGERILPEVVEPSFGIGRILYSVLEHSYEEDKIDGEERKVLRFQPELAPNDVAVFPLMNEEGMDSKAEEIAEQLRKEGLSVRYDDSGSIGRRYRRQDEIGTPYCVTVDHQTMEDSTVTLRDRDSTEQERVKIKEIKEKLR